MKALTEMRLPAAFVRCRGNAAGSRISILIALAGGLATAQGPILSFTATNENVAGAHDSIRIDVLRWSTDTERDQLVSAWSMTGATGRGGRGGGGRGGRGAGAEPVDPVPDPDAIRDSAAASGGRAGRGRGSVESAPPLTPESSLAAALQRAPTVGYLWSSEVAGYALRYAGRVIRPDGVERIILITNRRLGAANDLWKPVGPGTPANYDFSVIELRVNSKGEGEGKASLLGKVAPDGAAKVITPEDYDALPVVLRNVRGK
jgi:hypothetical protein